MKSTVIEPVGGHGGMAPYDFNLCQGLGDNGVDVALYTSAQTSPPDAPSFSFRPTYQGVFGSDPGWVRATRFIRATLWALLDSVREGRRVCHFHFFLVGPLEFANVVVARLLGRKVVITAHDVECFVAGLDAPGLPRLTYRLAHAVIAHNQVSKDELVRGKGLSQDKIFVIPAGNHLNSIPKVPSPAEARISLGLPRLGPILLFFGQIKDVKGLDLLLEAMPAILTQNPKTTLVIAGRPRKKGFDEYQEIIDRLGIGSNVSANISYIPDEDLPLYFQACDLVTLPYRRIYQSDVLLMAMSYGKPIVTSDIPGMMEIVKDGETGFVFQSGNVIDLARCINLALSDIGKMDQIAHQGKMLMKSSYSWEKIGSSMASLYAALLK